MISKITPTGGSFSGTCRYICQKLERAQVLDASGVRAHDHRLMAKDFECQRELLPDRRNAVFHGILSFPAQENPGNALMVELAHKYLDRLGMKDTQYVITRHTDTAHPHLHIIANFVNNHGDLIPGDWNRRRGIAIARELTEEYQLIPQLKKNLEVTHRENMEGADAKRYEIFVAIKESLTRCLTLEELEKQLLMKTIETRYRHDKKTGERVGISFRLGKIAFKGSSIDPEFSFKRLERTLAERLKLELSQRMDSRETPDLHQTLEKRQLLVHEDRAEKVETLRPRMRLHL